MSNRVNAPKERVRAWLVDSIRFYRQLGFFARQAGLTDEAIADVIESYQQAAPEPFVPEQPYSDLLLLRYDNHRVVFEDLTERIRRGTERYQSILTGLAHISRGSFDPQNLKEQANPEGTVQLEFRQGGRRYQLQARSEDQRFDMMVLEQLNLALFASPYRFEVIDPGNGSVFVTALTAQERTLIERRRRLPFYVLDLARMLEPLSGFGQGRQAPPPGALRFVGTLNEFADRSLGKLELQVKVRDVTGTFRYYGADHSERFEFRGLWSIEEELIGGTFRGSIHVNSELRPGEEDRFHPYLGDWVGVLSPGMQVAYGTWRGWLADDGGEEGPEDPALMALGQWGVLDEELLASHEPYLRRLRRWLQQVWKARGPDDYPMTISPGL